MLFIRLYATNERMFILHGRPDSQIFIMNGQEIAVAGHNPGGLTVKTMEVRPVDINGNGNHVPVEAQYLFRKAVECSQNGKHEALNLKAGRDDCPAVFKGIQ